MEQQTQGAAALPLEVGEARVAAVGVALPAGLRPERNVELGHGLTMRASTCCGCNHESWHYVGSRGTASGTIREGAADVGPSHALRLLRQAEATFKPSCNESPHLDALRDAVRKTVQDKHERAALLVAIDANCGKWPR